MRQVNIWYIQMWKLHLKKIHFPSKRQLCKFLAGGTTKKRIQWDTKQTKEMISPHRDTCMAASNSISRQTIRA